MGLFDHFPYTNFHELNLTWILEMLKEIDRTMDEFVAINALKYADPIQWNIVSQYEKNTIVIDPLTGSAYISVQPVPTGVSLSNTDYWTIVFDLGMFVVRAAKNLANTYEADTTLTATVSTPAGGWIIWGDTLYKALVNITAGDSYVDGGNITHFTIEDVIGHLEDLNTTDKTNLVAAINELLVSISGIGDLNDLDTTDKSTLVAAVNEVLQALADTCGDLDDLNTTDKSNLVAAINEVLQTLTNTAGDLNDLNTTDNSNLVAAINENELNIRTLPNTFSYAVAQVKLDCVNGDDDNDGLDPATPMKTIHAALTKYARYGYINLHFIEPGFYDVPESYVIGHASCFMNESGGTVEIGNSSTLFYIACHVEILGVTFKCRVELRNATVVIGQDGSIPDVALSAFIDGIIDFGNCSIYTYGAEFANTIYITGCKAYFNNVLFKNGSMISANSTSEIAFKTVEIQNDDGTRFMQAFNGCTVVFTELPTLTINANFTNSLWLSNSKLSCSRDTFQALDSIGSIHSTGSYTNYDGYPMQDNIVKRPLISMANGDDLNNYVHGGTYQCPNTTIAASLSNSPVADRAFNLMVFEGSSPVCEQIIMTLNTSQAGTIYRRRRSSSNIWGSWAIYKESSIMPPSDSIAASSDLNSFTHGGTYYCQNSTTAATLSNSPVTDRAFKLTINECSSNGYLIQEIIPNTSDYTKYVRMRSSGGTFGAWKTIDATNV